MQSKPTPPSDTLPKRLLASSPDILTFIAISSAMSSVFFALHQQWNWAILCVYIAAILDGLDGKLARYLKVNSPHGELLDSIADFANFGLVPGLLFYICFESGWLVALFYSLCILYRLIRFYSVQKLTGFTKSGEARYFFAGTPSPESALLVCLPIIMSQGLELSFPPFPANLFLLSVALLAVSPFPVYSPKFLKPKVFVGLFTGLAAGALLGWTLGLLWQFLVLADGMYILLLLKSSVHYRLLSPENDSEGN